MKAVKRTIAGMLVFVLCIGMFSFQAFAAEDETDAAAGEDFVVELSEDEFAVVDEEAEVIGAETEAEEPAQNEMTIISAGKIQLSSVSLKYKKKQYTGKAITQTKTTVVKAVVDGEKKTLTKGTDYTISYKNNVNIGKATVIVKGKGNYTGTIEKSFKIVPKGTSISKLKAAKKAFTVTWKKQATQTSGYQIQCATDSGFTKNRKTVTISNTKTTSQKISNLKGGKKYYVRVRTYKKVNGEKYYSTWSEVKTVKTLAADSKSVLLKKIKKKTDLSIARTFYADFDGDGKKEMFAVTEGWNHVWFASTSQVKCCLENTYLWADSARIVTVSSKQKLFIAENYLGGPLTWSQWFYVKNGKVKGNNISVWNLQQIKGKDFAFYPRVYDGYTRAGEQYGTIPTSKRYYLHWTGSTFEEYKGSLITKKELKKYVNGSSVLQEIQYLGYTVDDIYKRTNGIININIHPTGSYGENIEIRRENVNLKNVDNKVEVIVINPDGEDIVEQSSYGGVYMAYFLT